MNVKSLQFWGLAVFFQLTAASTGHDCNILIIFLYFQFVDHEVFILIPSFPLAYIACHAKKAKTKAATYLHE